MCIRDRNGGRHDLVLFESNTAPERPFTYTVNYVRVSFVASTSFNPTGGGGGASINEGISETVNGLNLNQFYGVDDGED